MPNHKNKREKKTLLNHFQIEEIAKKQIKEGKPNNATVPYICFTAQASIDCCTAQAFNLTPMCVTDR